MTEEDVAMAHKQFNVKRYKVVHQAREDLRARRRRAEMQAKQDDPFHRLHQTPLELTLVSGKIRPIENSVREKQQRVNTRRATSICTRKSRRQREGRSNRLSTSCNVLSRKLINEHIRRAREGRLRHRYMKTAAVKVRNAESKRNWYDYNQAKSFFKQQAVDNQFAKHRDKARVVLIEDKRREEIMDRITNRHHPMMDQPIRTSRKKALITEKMINSPDLIRSRIEANEMSVRQRKRFVPKHIPLLAYRHFGEVHEPKVPPFASSALSRAAPVSIRVCDPVTGPTRDGFD